MASESVDLKKLKEKIRLLQGKEKWCLYWENVGAEAYCEHDTHYFDTKEEALDKLEDLKRDFGAEMLEWDLEKKRNSEIDAKALLCLAEKEAKKAGR